jgi:hypothetical protein
MGWTRRAARLSALAIVFASACSASQGSDPSGRGPDDNEDAGTERDTGTSSDGSATSDGSTKNDAEAGTDLGLCSSAALEPQAAATIDGFISTLPSDVPDAALRKQIVDIILRACHAFTPSAAGYEERYCWAHLVSAILKESSYNPQALVQDDYASRSIGGETANDPTVGLLQIRFSATVHDVAQFAPLDVMACIGCTLPSALVQASNDQPGDSSFWAVSGPTDNMSLMTDPACNIAFGAWYYYMNATGNGRTSSPVYAKDYCDGNGVTANLVTGLRSHFLGPDKANGVINDISELDPNDSSYEYVTDIKARFDPMIGTVSTTHPFFVPLAPEKSRYCR